MKLYSKTEWERHTPSGEYIQTVTHDEPATLSDLKAALAEHGMVAVPVEPNVDMSVHGALAHADCEGDKCESARNVYKAMIRAAQENQQ